MNISEYENVKGSCVDCDLWSETCHENCTTKPFKIYKRKGMMTHNETIKIIKAHKKEKRLQAKQTEIECIYLWRHLPLCELLKCISGGTRIRIKPDIEFEE